MCGRRNCPWGIGQHPATLADARDSLTVMLALREAGPIAPDDAKRRYDAWRARWRRDDATAKTAEATP